MGPLAFALGLDAALDTAGVDDYDGILWQSWYLDDGTIVGRSATVTSFFDKLTAILPQVGLTLNPSKCVLWGPGVQAADDMEPKLPTEIPPDHPCGKSPSQSMNPILV